MHKVCIKISSMLQFLIKDTFLTTEVVGHNNYYDYCIHTTLINDIKYITLIYHILRASSCSFMFLHDFLEAFLCVRSVYVPHTLIHQDNL